MDRTNIIETDEVARAIALASQGKGKGKGKKKATEARASSPPKPKKTNTVPTARATAKATASATPVTTATSTQASVPRFYEANGLKIPLYNQDGLGNKKRQYARLSKALLKNNTDQLLDIVEQYARADKRQELKNKGLSKSRLANWIEEKETLALGRNPKSTLSIAEDEDEEEEAESSDDAASPLASTAPISSGTKTKKHDVTASNSNNKEDDSLVAAKDHGTCDQPSHRKRSASDGSPDGQPYAKLQKRDVPANSVATSTGYSVKDNSIGKSVDDVIPTHPQTVGQTAAYNDKDYDIYLQNAFMQSTGMDPSHPDRSSMILRGDGEDRVLTATSGRGFREGATYLHETTVPHGATDPPESASVPYLKEGQHGRCVDFEHDPNRGTGVGHQMEPNDHLKWDEFKTFRSMLYEQFPHYPKSVNGVSVDSETKDTWDQWQTWYGDFVEKYPGYAVAHLWPCGCEKASEEDESEEKKG